MKVRQTLQHLAARAALETPLVGDRVRKKLVELHTRVFVERAPERVRPERRPRLDAFFDATMDIYLAALGEGYTEARAREITHILANAEFHRHGWFSMMEFPPAELDDNLARYQAFFQDHGITPDNPLGQWMPEGGLPPATEATPEEREAVHAEAGYGNDLYVEDREGNVARGEEAE